MDAIYEEIYGAHLPFIKAGQIAAPVLVAFSAIPGSGKSELTWRLTNTYGFLGVANKDIRHAMKQTNHESDVVIGDYTIWLLDKLARRNEGIVFDRNIDQWYEPVVNWAKEHSYKLVVVRIEVSRSTLEKRLHQREGENVAKVLEVLDFYTKQHQQISATIKADILLKEDYDLDTATKDIADITIG